MNPPSFTDLSTTEDSENLVEEINKVFDVMHVIDVERVYLDAYQLKNVATNLFKQWKEGKDEDSPHTNWSCFEKAFLRRFFP